MRVSDYADADFVSHPYSNQHSDLDGDSKQHIHEHANPNPDTQQHSNGDVYSDEYVHTDADACLWRVFWSKWGRKL